MGRMTVSRAKAWHEGWRSLRPFLLLALIAPLCGSAGAVHANVTVPTEARGESAFNGGEARVRAKLLIDSSTHGEPLRVGILFELKRSGPQ